MSSVVDRFIKYVKIDTQSDDTKTCVPSTEKQFNLSKVLGEELREMGMKDVVVDDHAYVFANLPGNVTDRKVPSIGFCAHVDTALEVTDTNVSPRFVKDYDGGDIVLDAAEGVVLSPKVFPLLKKAVGDTLIVTDGKTLLGADDKAGIAEIMAACEYMIKHPEFKHGDVKVCFCPDEEIGHGARLLDVKKFGADFCYTLDGGEEGNFSYETFNAAKAAITIKGRAVHPGSSKNRMINSIRIGMELAYSFPQAETPEHTENYEGYYHLLGFHGTCESTRLDYIIRDHDRKKFEARKEMVRTLVRQMNERHGEGTVTLDMQDQYYNMADLISKHMHMVNTALKAMKLAGVEPEVIPVRGGTDGSQLSYRGLLTPNLFTGGVNAHGKYEYVPVKSMEKAVQTVLNLLNLYATGQEVE